MSVKFRRVYRGFAVTLLRRDHEVLEVMFAGPQFWPDWGLRARHYPGFRKLALGRSAVFVFWTDSERNRARPRDPEVGESEG